MGRKALVIGGVLIGVYLVLGKATNFGQVINASGNAGVGVVKAFQGR